MIENNSILKILDSNLTNSQKEALLGSLADEIIEKKQVEKDSFEAKREELIEKERQKAEETRKRLANYEERSLKEENQTKRNEELEDKIKALSEITNARGEKIYSDLSDLSGYEIDNLYSLYIEKDKEKNESNQVNSNNEEKANVEKVNSSDKKLRELTLEEANKVLDLAIRVGPLTSEEQNFIYNLISETGVQNQDELVNNAKSLAGISENNYNPIENNNNDNNYRDLTIEEAQKLVEYENKLKDRTITEEEKLTLKPIIDDLMTKTGIADVQNLFDKANEIVDNNVKEGNFIGNPLDFVKNIEDVSQLNEEQAATIRNELGLDEGTSLNNEYLNEMKARLIAEQPLKKEPEKRSIVKKIGEGFSGLKERVDMSAANAVKAIGTIALVGVAVVAGGIAIPELAALAAGGLGVKAVQDFNKGKKL